MKTSYFKDIARFYQDNGSVSKKPKKRIFIASVSDREPTTFIEEAKAAGRLSEAQGVPFEIIPVENVFDWYEKVKPLVEKSKGQGVQWGVFGHTNAYGQKVPSEHVDTIMSDTDEVFLGSCSGLYCATKLPKTVEKSKLYTNYGDLFTGVPRFKDYASKIKQLEKSNPDQDPFFGILYGNDSAYTFKNPGALKGEDYIDWSTFDPTSLTKEQKELLVRRRALSDLRHTAYSAGLERPTTLPPDFIITDSYRERLLGDLGLLPRRTPRSDRDLQPPPSSIDRIFNTIRQNYRSLTGM